jgi:hypothetical protein
MKAELMTWRALIAALVWLAMPVVAQATPSAVRVSVSFVHPERFNDQDFRVRFTPAQRAAALADLARHIERAGAAILKPGQALKIEIFDLRRAGMERMVRGADMRVFTDVTPPTVSLRYTLSGGRRRAQSGTKVLTDMNYLSNPSARFSGDRFAYEKALIDDWLRQIAAR